MTGQNHILELLQSDYGQYPCIQGWHTRLYAYTDGKFEVFGRLDKGDLSSPYVLNLYYGVNQKLAALIFQGNE